MNRTRVLTQTLMTIVALTFSGVAAAVTPGEAAAQALSWLKTQQNDDGGFGSGFAPGSAVGSTADAVIAITSGGQDASAWNKRGKSPIDYLSAQVSGGKVTLPGDIAKTILAAVASGQNPRAFGGQSLIANLNTHLDASTGLYSASMFDQALAILALRNAGEPVPEAAVTALLGAQTVEGGWAFTGDTSAGAADSNTTSLAVQALVAVGRKDATGRALDYFRRVQNSDGGWTYQVPSAFGTDTDANSTALGAQAVLAVGDSLSNWLNGASDPVGALLTLQNSDGSFSFNNVFPGANTLATLQAIPALFGTTFVQLNVVPAAGASAPVAVLLPEAGSALDASPVLALLGAMLIAAAFLARRRVRVS